MFKTLKGNKLVYFAWGIIFVFVGLGVCTTKAFSILALLFFIVYAFIFPVKQSCILLFGLLPLANIFKFSSGTTSFFTICEILFAVVALIRRAKIKTSLIIALFVLAAYMLLTDIPSFNLLGVIKIVLGFYLLHIMSITLDKESLVNIARLLAISTILMMLLCMNEWYFEYVKTYLENVDYVFNSSGDVLVRMGGFLGDPNYCALLIVMTISLLCVLYYYRAIKNEFWIYVLLLIPLGFFTYSKSYFLTMAVLILFLIFFILIPRYKGWAFVSIVGLICFGMVVFNGKVETINILLKRFKVEDFTTGRDELNVAYLNYIWNNPKVLFFGSGISTNVFDGAANNVHNFYIETLFKFGLIGCILYYLTLLLSLGRKKMGKIKFVDCFPLLFLGTVCYFLAAVNMYEMPFYLGIVSLSLDYSSLNGKERIKAKLRGCRNDAKEI